MKVITAQTDPNRKLVAIVGSANKGLFLRPIKGESGHFYLNSLGQCFHDKNGGTLEKVLEDHKDRHPVYEGEQVTLQF